MNEMTNVTTGEVRFSYVHVFKPYAAQPGQEERYSVTVLDAEDCNRHHGPHQCCDRSGKAERGFR